MYFPRVLAFDRLRGRLETFGSCGAAAGMIARCDETWPVWAPAESDDAVLRPGLRPSFMVSDTERARLMQAGVNTLLAVRPSGASAASPRTLAAGNAGAADWKFLSARRLALFITASIERGTRWLLFEQNGPAAWRRAQSQVRDLPRFAGSPGRFRRRAARRELLRDLRRAGQRAAHGRRGQDQGAVRLCDHQAVRLPRVPGHAPARREPLPRRLAQPLRDRAGPAGMGDRDRRAARHFAGV